MRILFLSMLAISFGLAGTAQASLHIAKVLPHLIDKQGRQSTSPSLFERDAYQGWLRHHPEEVSTLRYDFQWKGNAAPSDPITVKLEVRGSRSDLRHPSIFEKPLAHSGWGKWSYIPIPEEDFRKLGSVVGWRLSLWQKGVQIAEQKSFLW